MSSATPPTRPDSTTDDSVSTVTPEWVRFMGSVKRAAEDAWATGRKYYEANFLALDNSPKFAKPEDVAGAIEAIESVGWRLEHVGYVNVSGAGQATGVFDSAALKVRGFYLFRRLADDA
jgi:hypothetical protein